jgi:hypothetical protein
MLSHGRKSTSYQSPTLSVVPNVPSGRSTRLRLLPTAFFTPPADLLVFFAS